MLIFFKSHFVQINITILESNIINILAAEPIEGLCGVHKLTFPNAFEWYEQSHPDELEQRIAYS